MVLISPADFYLLSISTHASTPSLSKCTATSPARGEDSIADEPSNTEGERRTAWKEIAV